MTRNRWQSFNDEEELEITRTTNNPIRKIKKKIRKKEERYEKNPSPELFNEIKNLKEHLKIFTFEPVKKTKKKKFKKKRIDKAKEAKEKKWKKEKERARRFNEQYNKWRESEYEKHKQRRETSERQRESEYNRRCYEEQQDQLKKIQFISSLPEDIMDWMAAPDKKGYYKLMKIYHPDKNKNKDNEFAKFITSHWGEMSIL
jgi:hypothetical protein